MWTSRVDDAIAPLYQYSSAPDQGNPKLVTSQMRSLMGSRDECVFLYKFGR